MKARSLVTADIAEALKLSDQQKQELKSLYFAFRAHQGPKAEADFNQKAVKVLTTEQKTTLQKMMGPATPPQGGGKRPRG